MQIRAHREALIAVLAKVVGVVERRQTLPILGNILISASDGLVHVTGTDLEVEISATSEATVEYSGETTLPARKLIDICRALPEGTEISLKVEKDKASLSGGRSRFTLGTLPASDFPTMEWREGIESVEVPQIVLKYLLDKTAFAMAHQDVRYYLNGLLMEVKPDRLVTVATDGHRLAKVEEEIALGIGAEMQIILPRKTVGELNRLLGSDTKDLVRLDISEKVFRACIDDVVLTSKLVDGRYPDYQRVIPPTPERVAYADKELLRQALLRTSILSNEKFKGIRFSLDQGQLRLQAQNPEQDEAEEEVDVIYAQEPITVGFNVGYLIDVLNVLEGDEVEIGFQDSDSSAILRNKNQEKETFVVMPMRL